MHEVEILQFLRNRKVLEVPQVVWFEEVEDRLLKLTGNKNYMDLHLARLMGWAGMSVGRPTRRSSMTLSQEDLGWQATMDTWGRAIWMAVCGSSEQLERGSLQFPVGSSSGGRISPLPQQAKFLQAVADAKIDDIFWK